MSVVDDLLGSYQHVIAEIKLVMGSKGIFDVTVDGQLLYSKYETGRHATDGEILQLFSEHVGPDVRRYGT